MTLVGLLIVIGVASSAGRAAFVGTFGARVEEIRQRIAPPAGQSAAAAKQRMDEIKSVECRFEVHRGKTLLHVIPGAAFVLLAPLQFMRGLRTRHPRVHRWLGRLLVLTGVITVIPGFYFGVLAPVAGIGEATIIAIATTMFVLSLARAVLAIRRGDVTRHREWMIRGFAMAIAIATVRIVAGVADGPLTRAGWSLQEIFVLSMWTGWAVTIVAAELWIVRTRLTPMRREATFPSSSRLRL